jgi:hypothetical protein
MKKRIVPISLLFAEESTWGIIQLLQNILFILESRADSCNYLTHPDNWELRNPRILRIRKLKEIIGLLGGHQDARIKILPLRKADRDGRLQKEIFGSLPYKIEKRKKKKKMMMTRETK